MDNYAFTEDEWNSCMKVLNILKNNPIHNPDNEQFKTLITSIYKKVKKDTKKYNLQRKKEEDAWHISQTSIIANARNITTLYTHNPTTITESNTCLHIARHCYVCNQLFTQLHFFYHKLCPSCAEEHYKFRSIACDFTGYTILLTGGRVKIGYATALKFLRAGANLMMTTRFPALALEQYRTEPDFDDWKDRLTIYGLDLRNLKAVDDFIQFCYKQLSDIDILINNAAQTIKYSSSYYEPLMFKEQLLLNDTSCPKLTANATPVCSPLQQNFSYSQIDPLVLNRFGQPIDHRGRNSWNALMDDVPLEELLEVNLINHISPYQLIVGLKSLLCKSKHLDRFIINVTSSEGQFSYPNKTAFHPHTNMTKAALNMLTRTSAQSFIKEGIYMNAVDVGWVSTGVVEEKRVKLFEKLHIPPLDPVDSASRIMQPIVDIINGNKKLFGVLLKNYKVADW